MRCLGGEHSANWAPAQISSCDFSGTPVRCLHISKTLAAGLTKIYLLLLRKHLIIPIRVFIGNRCLIFYQLFPYLIFSSDPIIPQMLITSTPKITLSPNSHSEALTTMQLPLGQLGRPVRTLPVSRPARRKSRCVRGTHALLFCHAVVLPALTQRMRAFPPCSRTMRMTSNRLHLQCSSTSPWTALRASSLFCSVSPGLRQ